MNRSTFDAMLAQYSKNESSGDGSVSWENGAHCIIPEVKIGGKAEQVQYTGKNLADVGSRYSSWGGDRYTTVMREGRHQDPQLRSALIPVIGGETYTASCEGNPINQRCFWFDQYPIVNETVSIYGQYPGSGYNKWVIKAPDNAKWLLYVFCDDTSATEVPVTNCQIELGSTATSYEPYTGGIPVPNPNYPIMPTFSDGTKVVSRGRNLADAFIANDQYSVKTEKIAPNTFRITRDSPTNPRGYGQIKIEGLPKNHPVCVVCSVRDQGDPTEDRPYAQLYPWKEPNASEGYYASILHLGYLGEATRRSEPFIATTGYLYCGMYPNLANDGDSAVYEIAVYLADDDTEACDPVYFDGGEAVAPELLAIPGTEYRDEWDAQTGKGVRRVGKQVFDESNQWVLSGYSVKGYNAFYSNAMMPNGVKGFGLSCLCTHFLKKKHPSEDEMGVVAGLNNNFVYFFVPKEQYPDAASFSALITEKSAAGDPVTVWIALPESIEFQTDPQSLVQPKGYGQLIQTDGTLDDCPITVTPVTHQ